MLLPVANCRCKVLIGIQEELEVLYNVLACHRVLWRWTPGDCHICVRAVSMSLTNLAQPAVTASAEPYVLARILRLATATLLTKLKSLLSLSGVSLSIADGFSPQAICSVAAGQEQKTSGALKQKTLAWQKQAPASAMSTTSES